MIEAVNAAMTDFYNESTASQQNRPQSPRGLLGAGWRPLQRELDWAYLGNLLLADTAELVQRSMMLTSELANALGRRDYAWWANGMNLFSSWVRDDLDRFWDYITPDPAYPDYRYSDHLSVSTPVPPIVTRDAIPMDHVCWRLQDMIIQRILQHLGRPDFISQYYLDRHFYFPVEKFVSWERLEVIHSAYAYWHQADLWLQIEPQGKQRRLTLQGVELQSLISKVTYGLAVMLSGYQSRVGQIQSDYGIRTFPQDVQDFTDIVQEKILEQSQLAVLVSGQPGTGKTAWTQAVAQEILQPLGYVTFILDHEAVQQFVPPDFLDRVCLIINEADNLAQNRALETAQTNSKTERILSLLDGTLYRSVLDEAHPQTSHRMVVLLTCNTTERLDPAILRKGRIDLMANFTHCFV